MSSLLYKSTRIGKNGIPFQMIKFRTLKDGTDKSSSFAKDNQYTRFGKFLRKTKLDELPQLWNIIKGNLRFFGYRAEEAKTFSILPEGMKQQLIKEKPGLIDLSSLHFFDEEAILQLSKDSHEVYWKAVRPMKFTLQMFYMQNRCFLLNLAIVWIFFKKSLLSIIKS